MSVLDFAHFHNEDAAYEHVERLLWPNGPVCPHCAATGDKIGRLNGKTARPGLRKCYSCRKQFTVKIGTIFEDSHAPLRLWLQAIYLMSSSKKGISTRQLQRTLGVGMKTAWFMGHRIRLAMAPGADAGPLGGEGMTVEADETYLAKSPKTRKTGAKHARNEMKVLSLVERGGKIRSTRLTHRNIGSLVASKVHEDSRLVTDGANFYKFTGLQHEFVDHSKYEWVRGDVHTNADPYLVAFYTQDSDDNIITNDYGLSHPTRQDQHD